MYFACDKLDTDLTLDSFHHKYFQDIVQMKTVDSEEKHTACRVLKCHFSLLCTPQMKFHNPQLYLGWQLKSERKISQKHHTLHKRQDAARGKEDNVLIMICVN